LYYLDKTAKAKDTMKILAKTTYILCLVGAASADYDYLHRNLQTNETMQSNLTPMPPIPSSPLPFTYWHNYVGHDGRSHLAKCTFDWTMATSLHWADQPTWMDHITPQVMPQVTKTIFAQMHMPNGSINEWHSDPGPQLVVVMQGHQGWEVEDGQKMVLGPGDVYFGEDQDSKGHLNHGLGETFHFIMVRYDNHIRRKGQPCWLTSNSTAAPAASAPAPTPAQSEVSASTSRIDKIKLELANARTKEGLDDDNAIVVCVGADNPGLSVRDDDGQYRGFEVEVSKLVVAELELAINETLNIMFVSPTLDERLQYLETQHCVFLADLLTNIPERREVVSFTPPYLVIKEELLAFRSEDITSPQDCKAAAVAAGSATLVRYEEKFKTINLVLTESNGDGVELLLNGTVDCMANDNIVFKEILDDIDEGVYKGVHPGLKSADLERISTGNTFPPKPWGLGVSDDTPWLLKELTEIMIYAAADGRLGQLRDEHGFGDGNFGLEPDNCSCNATDGCNIVGVETTGLLGIPLRHRTNSASSDHKSGATPLDYTAYVIGAVGGAVVVLFGTWITKKRNDGYQALP
jgi:ABC-type amino acid transport substrate-binding protein/quercetin dioxygenase-like cupin family protein